MSAALFLFTLDVLKCSAHSTGISETVFFHVASFYCLIKGKSVLSGVAAGLAVQSGMYALVLLGCFVVYLMWVKAGLKESVAPLIAGFAAVTVLFSGFFYLTAGVDYVNGVVLYT